MYQLSPSGSIRELNLQEGLSLQERADHYGCSSTLIENRLRRYGIPTRAPGSEPIGLSEEELTELYVDREHTVYELADRYDCDPTVVERRPEWYGVETRHTCGGSGWDWTSTTA